MDALHLPWLGQAHPKRTYRLIRPKNKPVCEGKPKHWLTKTYAATDWHLLSDDGCRVVILGEADDESLGRVTLLLVEDMSESSLSGLLDH